MTAEERAELKTKIETNIISERENIEKLIELTQPIKPENSLGRISRMDAINNKSINDAALRQAKMRLSRMEYAITKIEDLNFGKCASCKNKINPKRLMLMPESTLCVRCASRR